MKKIILITFLLFHSAIHAQTHLQWSTAEVTPGSQVNQFEGMATDAHGNTYTINFTQNNSNQWFSYRFFCYNSNGVKMWQYDNDSCFTNCQDIYKNIIPLDNGAIFIGTYNDLSGNDQIRIKRIDINGNLLWQKYWQYIRLSPLYPLAIKLDHAGNIVIGFSGFGAPDFTENFAFAKFDTIAGNELWHFELPDQGPNSSVILDEAMSDIEVDANNNIYLSGDASNPFANIFRKYYFSVSPTGSMNYSGFTNYSIGIGIGSNDICLDGAQSFYHLLNFNSNTVVFKQDTAGGFFQWTTALQHDSANMEPFVLLTDSSSLYVLSNYSYFIPDSSFAGGFTTNKHYCITKLDTSGNTLWQKDYFTNWDSLSVQNGAGGATGMLFCNNNLYVLSNGFTDSASFKMILHKLDTGGNTIWYDTTSTGPAGPMSADDNCNIYTSRSTQPPIGGYYYCLTQKFSDAPLSIKQNETITDEIQVYPNPAHDNVTIQLKNKADAFLYIHIYNSVGQRVYAEARNDNKTIVSLKNLSAGVYIIETHTKGGGQFYKKVIVDTN